MDETMYFYWLCNIPGIGTVTVKRLLDEAKNAENVWKMSEESICRILPDVNPARIRAITDSRLSAEVERSYADMLFKGITFIPFTDPIFPGKLKKIPHPPAALYLKGRLPDPHKLSVAVIGARNCSEYGRYIARKTGIALAEAGIQVISGLARGVDCISQKGALDRGGYSCAVLGCGADVCYPSENIQIYNDCVIKGGVISEYPPGTGPKSCLFPMRNRIISGLSDIVVIVEARERSGSLITADMALEQGKDVYAYPGRVTDSLSHGCNRLIRQGAGIILSPEELLNDLSVNYGPGLTGREMLQSAEFPSPADTPVFPEPLYSTLSENDKKILSALSLDAKSLTTLMSETGLSIGPASQSVLNLTMRGLITKSGSGYVFVPK